MMSILKLFMLTSIVFWTLRLRNSGCDASKQQALLKHLMKDYGIQARPVLDETIPTNVTFGVELVQLIKIDDRSQTVTLKLWVRQAWKNQLLRWNSSDWNGVRELQIDPSYIWVPDVALYNNADKGFSGGQEKFKTKIRIRSDGSNFWFAPATFTSTCSINIAKFPFDKQRCSLKFGSWAYDISGINMEKDSRPIITSQFAESTEWKVIDSYKEKNLVYYKCCPNPFPDVTLVILIQRKSLYYLFNVITPCIFVAASILTGFFLPPESGERISLTITILLAIAVFLQLVNDNLPRTSDQISVLGIFYVLIMIESLLSLITTCVILTIHYSQREKDGFPLPRWVKLILIDYIGSYLAPKTTANLRDKNIRRFETHFETEADGSFEVITNGFVPSKTNRNIGRNFVKSFTCCFKGYTCHGSTRVERLLKSINWEVMQLNAKAHNSDSVKERQEWKILKIVLDRLFFIAFLITFLIAFIAVLLPAYLDSDQ